MDTHKKHSLTRSWREGKKEDRRMARKTSYLALLITIASGVLCAAHRQTYEGYSLYRCQPQTSYQVERLRSLRDDKVDGDGVQFWSEPSVANAMVDVMLAPEEQENALDEFRNFRIPCKMIMYDVGEVIRRTSTPQVMLQSYTDVDEHNGTLLQYESLSTLERFHSQYHNYAAIEAKLAELATNPMVSREIAGYSYEKRPLYLVKVSADRGATKKPVIFIDAGHHAREWISHSTLLYLLDSLIYTDMPTAMKTVVSVNESSSEEEDCERALRFPQSLRSLLDKYDFWFMPVVNPDGYEYTHQVNRLWRKTRSGTGLCSGVDPNRNYAFHWRERGASAFPCADTYAGPKALSEPETRALAGILDGNNDRIVMYLSLHAYSQLILVPYGYEAKYPDNYEQLKRVAARGQRAIQLVRGTRYEFGVSSVVLYAAAGGSDDYAHGVSGIKLSYTIELPDRGPHGFLMPPSEIIPIGQETAEGIAAMVSAI